MSHFYNEQGDLVPGWTKGCYPSPSTILDLIANPGIEAYRERLGSEAADEHMTIAQERGTRVHLACELWVTNGYDALSAATGAQLLEGDERYFDGFINWWETFNPELVASEMFLINRKLKYAGRTDLVVRLDGHLWIVDIKTGQTRVKHGLQVKFYEAAYHNMHSEHARQGGLYLDTKRASGYRYFKNEYGMLEYKESQAAIKAHLAVFKWWAKKEPIKKPLEVAIWQG